MERADFRVRKHGNGFRVYQFEAGKWVPLYAEVYPTREAAQAVIEKWVQS